MGYNKLHCENLASLKRCNMLFNINAIFYIIFCGLYIIKSLIMLITCIDGSELIYLFDGIIFKVLILACGYYGCYAKNNFYTLLTPGLCVINMIAFAEIQLNIVLLSISLSLSIVVIFASKKYKILEQTEGFPYFNERIDAQNELFNNPKDVYKEQYENIIKNSSDKMP